MNSLFLLIAAGLVVIALLIILPPLWRSRPLTTIDINARNTRIAQQQLNELKNQLQAGILSLVDYEAQRNELELALSDNLASSTDYNTNAIKHRAIVYVLIISIPVLATSLYAGLGTFQAIEATPDALTNSNNSTTTSLADIEKMVTKLAAHAQANPNDSQAWLMLGKSYKYLQQYPAAADAFAHAYSLLGEQPDIILLYADALALAQNEQLTGKPAELIFKALALEPNNIQALWLGGMAKAQAGDTTQAIILWRKLERLLPDNSPAKQETQQLLAKVQSQLTGDIISKPTAVNKSSAEITVQVSLADHLKTLVNANDTLFIYAQASATQKMPLAIIRKQVKDLPVTVILNDSLAMTPTMKVSSFDNVIISARISKSGQANTQVGDLIGTIDSVAVIDKNSHAIIINQQVQ